MIRFAWLQSRHQTLIVAAALAALAVAAAITGIHLAHLYNTLVAHCQTGCGVATDQFLSHDRLLQQALNVLTQLAPALFGIFWGAPLISREFETGTYRLAWTQTVTRSRWLLTKLGVIGLGTVGLATLLTITVTWWYRALDAVGTNQYAVFDRRDIAPVAYALFGFAVGALIGVLLRRTVPAMAATLAVFVGARIAMTFWVRPHLLAPVQHTTSLLDADGFGFESSNGSPITLVAQASGPANSWTLSSHLLTTSGHVPTSGELAAFLHRHCPNIGPPPGTGPSGHRLADPEVFRACQAQASRAYKVLVTYQPANRYWALQWLEAGIFVALALLAGAGCYWWVTRRTA